MTTVVARSEWCSKERSKNDCHEMVRCNKLQRMKAKEGRRGADGWKEGKKANDGRLRVDGWMEGR